MAPQFPVLFLFVPGFVWLPYAVAGVHLLPKIPSPDPVESRRQILALRPQHRLLSLLLGRDRIVSEPASQTVTRLPLATHDVLQSKPPPSRGVREPAGRREYHLLRAQELEDDPGQGRGRVAARPRAGPRKRCAPPRPSRAAPLTPRRLSFICLSPGRVAVRARARAVPQAQPLHLGFYLRGDGHAQEPEAGRQPPAAAEGRQLRKAA